MKSSSTPASRLRRLLKRPGAVRSLGAHDVFSALIAQEAGFDAVFLGGFGASASLLGMPDLNLLTLDEMAGAVRRMAGRLSVPVVADGDTGHGGVHNVARTVEEFERAGAAGIILEDQVSPKRCGHFAGKDVIPAPEMVAKLRAAVDARKDADFVIIARTDAREGAGLAEAVRRATLYRRAGADVAFIEAPHGEDELEAIPKRVRGPLLVNMLTGGRTANPPAGRLEKWGYKIIVYPVESLMVAATAMRRLARSILDSGSVDGVRDEMIRFDELKKVLGLAEPRPKGVQRVSR
jgi:2,3-dimethylmalate lyase